MKKDELSAIDAIFEILENIFTLDKRMSVIEDNIKILNNKISKINKNIVASTENIQMPERSLSQVDLQAPTPLEPERLVLGNIKVYGYIVNRERKPIDTVSVNIYDTNSRLIKNMLTDINGYWECRLPPGSYGVEYIHKKFKPINKVVKLEDGIKSFEVR